MGLSGASTGAKVLNCCDGFLQIEKETKQDQVIALAGNPNVGKSTVFNSLTGMKQHTGNWPGKTVANAQGIYRYQGTNFILVDIPGTYSLMANSEEEEIARDFLCFGEPDATVVVADATCLERNLNLVLQTMEISGRVVLCVNLLDEAKKKKIRIDLGLLSRRLGIPVVGTSARSGKGLDKLMNTVMRITRPGSGLHPRKIFYGKEIEEAVGILQPAVEQTLGGKLNGRWVALKLLDGDPSLLKSLKRYLGYDILSRGEVAEKLKQARALLLKNSISGDSLRDRIVTRIIGDCEEICRGAVVCEKKEYAERDRKIDRILTSRITGIPIMLLLLALIFWLTIAGANYPSDLIASGLFWVETKLSGFFISISAPAWVRGLVVDGIYRTLAWVISVMLPPMAIFFPLFTLLEDLGYLPRVAFNLDNFFRKACAHGKQALTMCMGFGCNACGVIGCRIIDSPRERLIAILTNNFVPCNGRFAQPRKGKQIDFSFPAGRLSPLLFQGGNDRIQQPDLFLPVHPHLFHFALDKAKMHQSDLVKKIRRSSAVRRFHRHGLNSAFSHGLPPPSDQQIWRKPVVLCMGPGRNLNCSKRVCRIHRQTLLTPRSGRAIIKIEFSPFSSGFSSFCSFEHSLHAVH